MVTKKPIYVIIILLIAFIILFQPTRNAVRRVAEDFFYPFLNLALKIENIVGQKGLVRKSKNVLIAELFEMQKTNNKLAAKCEHLETFVNQNSELRKLLKLKVIPYYNYVFAEIIYRDPAEWFTHFTINKGEVDGIENGAVVLGRIDTADASVKSRFGVIGRIGSLSKHTASVNTIVSDACNLSVLIPENGATGILKGGKRLGNEFWSKISYLPRDLIYEPSSAVLTSGMNPLTPANLSVGSIIRGDSNAISVYNNLFVEARVKPSVDLNHLKFVLILVKKK